MNKYATSPDEDEILPNLLGFKYREEIAESELEGFLFAEMALNEELNENTIFNIDYVLKIHELALRHLYSFAGKYRTVNISKAGFQFPSAMYLAQNMDEFNREILLQVPKQYFSMEQLIQKVALVHGELLFIHPFREGNGRTARLLADLMVRQQGYNGLNFGKIDDILFPEYVKAVQSISIKNYSPMEQIIASLF